MKRSLITQHAICPLSAVPVRLKPEFHSMILSQILFGECVEILQIKNKHWIKIQSEYDKNLVGWVNAKQFQFLDEKYYHKAIENYAVAMELHHLAFAENTTVPILLGSSLPSFDGMSFKIQKDKYSYSGQAVQLSNEGIDPTLFTKITKKYINAPHFENGRTPFGIDAGAFVQLVCKVFQYRLPQLPEQMVNFGENIDFVDQSALGDLAFFADKEGRIIHVGILLGNKRIIHVYDRVRIDKIDHHGIYHLQYKKYTHKLRIIKRLLHFKENEPTNEDI